MQTVIQIPQLIRNQAESSPLTAASLLYRQHRMQKAADDGNPWEERLPGLLSRFPAIRVDGLRLLVRVERLYCLGKFPVGLL
jgi:hypothetical protein